jgi:hypothetical protein
MRRVTLRQVRGLGLFSHDQFDSCAETDVAPTSSRLDRGAGNDLRIWCIAGPVNTAGTNPVGSIAKEGFERRCTLMHADGDRLNNLSGRAIGCPLIY